MQFLFEFFPVLLFFMAFKFYDIYTATIIGMIATLAQTLLTRLWFKKWDRQQMITLTLFVVFGSITLYFHNPIFIKWKPTILFWLFAVLLVGSQLFTATPLTKRMMGHMIEGNDTVPSKVWQRLNGLWAVFFFLLGVVNLYIAYTYDNNVWVNFKFYGITASLFLLSVAQTLYLMRYMPKAT